MLLLRIPNFRSDYVDQGRNIWIGLIYDGASREWRWSDGSELTWDPWNEDIHGPSEPSCNENCCAYMRRTGQYIGKLFAKPCSSEGNKAKILCNACLNQGLPTDETQSLQKPDPDGELPVGSDSNIRNDALENLVGGLFGECFSCGLLFTG